MRIANIYPIKNQKHYVEEPFGMVLAHLVQEGLYKKEFFPKGHYIIMDNGLFEKAQVSTDLKVLIKLAEDCGLPIREIVVPDAINDSEKTKALFLENIETIKKFGKKYKFMFVAQAKDNFELAHMIGWINEHGKGLNLSVGISKLTPNDRAHPAALNIYQQCEYPIHFLGIKESYTELLAVARLVRSCDTSQLAFIAKNEKNYKEIDIINYKRKGVDIDLAVDEVDEKALSNLIVRQDRAHKVYGIL